MQGKLEHAGRRTGRNHRPRSQTQENSAHREGDSRLRPVTQLPPEETRGTSQVGGQEGAETQAGGKRHRATKPGPGSSEIEGHLAASWPCRGPFSAAPKLCTFIPTKPTLPSQPPEPPVGHGRVSPLGPHFCCTERWQRAHLSTVHTTLCSWPPRGWAGHPRPSPWLALHRGPLRSWFTCSSC